MGIGNDPATDLRGVGMLGLLHMLSDFSHENIIREVYQLSQDPDQVRMVEPT